jgi:hypothetical protein
MMNQKQRISVYTKYDGHCAYCGKPIEYKDMQVDHLIPQHAYISIPTEIVNSETNLMPSCRRCNHYKRANSLGLFRAYLKDMRNKVIGTYLGKVSVDYNMIEWKGWDGKFYFERMESDE